MAILTTELKFYRAAQHNDTATNGGRLSYAEIVSGVKNNVWPSPGQTELTSGSTKYRKVFCKVASAENLALNNSKAFVENFTNGADRVLLFRGTATDIQSGITTPRLYGCGSLDDDVSSSATQITVFVEDPADDIFQDGDTIRISDKATVNAETGTEEYAVITGTPSYVGNVATINLTAGLASAYLAANTRVASVIEDAEIATSFTTPVVTSAGGTVDDTGGNIVVDNVGAVDDDWTLTFTSSTAFNITRVNPAAGETLTGTTNSVTAPVNSGTSTPYFTLQTAFFGGSYLTGDTVTFSTTSATLPLWEKRVIPAGTGSLSGNSLTVAWVGESA